MSNPTHPRISVITPSFRQLEWLRLCAASVADQVGVNVEHLIQDAGTEGILDAIPNVRKTGADNNCAIFVEKDEGMYDAINRGAHRASGEICAYLNCDEQYLPGALQKVTDYFESHPEVDVLFADAVLVNREGEPMSYRRAVLPGALHTRLVHLNTLSCATFFRRSIIERGLLFNTEYRAIGDAVWVHDLLTAGVRMAVLSQPLSIFTFTGENLGASEKSKREMDRWRKSKSSPLDCLHFLVIIIHRIKKLLAGAYLPRSCTIQIYTLHRPAQRTEQSVKKISFGWPKSPVTEPGSAQSIPLSAVKELKIAAVFTTFNRSAVAIHGLECLLGQSRKLFRIVVADNNSSDGTSEEIRKRFGDNPTVDLAVLPSNLGNAGGISVAIQRALAAGADAIWILDDDSWARPDTLEKLMAHYHTQQVFSSLVVDPVKNELAWPYILMNPTPHLVSHQSELTHHEIFEIRGAWLGALVSKQILDLAGLPDERLFIRGEDEEFPLRIKQKGFRFFCVINSKLDHPAPNRLIHLRMFDMNFFYEPGMPMWKADYMIRNRVFIYQKYSDIRIQGIIKGVASVMLAIVVALLSDDQKFRRVLLYLRAGWHGLTLR